jgi:hypothetical protein
MQWWRVMTLPDRCTIEKLTKLAASPIFEPAGLQNRYARAQEWICIVQQVIAN